MTFWLFLAIQSGAPAFPEQTPALIEACLNEAVAENSVTADDGVYKYICSGPIAQDLWNYLESENIPSWEQTTDSGVWLSRTFPMGGCFKRLRLTDGSVAAGGLSCTIWIPRAVQGKE
jgi:hypothetical protein